MTAAAWMSHACVRRVIGKLLDQLDALPAEDRARDAGARLDIRLAPEIYTSRIPGDADLAWEALKEAERFGWIKIRTGKVRGPGYAEYECNPRITINAASEAIIRQALNRPVPVSANESWAAAVERSYHGAPEQKMLLASQSPIRIDGRSMDAVAGQFNLLPELAGTGMFVREASSRMFWGLSKILDNRFALLVGLTGNEQPFLEAPIQLQLHCTAALPEGVLIIENLTVFEAAKHGRYPQASRLALVYGAGFKGSARRLRTKEGSSLYFSLDTMKTSGSLPDQLTEWLYRKPDLWPVFFWGDLDYSGMGILRELRHSFPEIAAWEDGYAGMLCALERGVGHSPEEARKAGQVDPGNTGCMYADEILLPAIRKHGAFIDQE